MRGKRKGYQPDDPFLARINTLREQRDKMKVEAKKLSTEVKVENRKRVRLGRLAEKLSNTDLCNLIQQRGLNNGASSSAPAAHSNATTP